MQGKVECKTFTSRPPSTKVTYLYKEQHRKRKEEQKVSSHLSQTNMTMEILVTPYRMVALLCLIITATIVYSVLQQIFYVLFQSPFRTLDKPILRGWSSLLLGHLPGEFEIVGMSTVQPVDQFFNFANAAFLFVFQNKNFKAEQRAKFNYNGL